MIIYEKFYKTGVEKADEYGRNILEASMREMENSGSKKITVTTEIFI